MWRRAGGGVRRPRPRPGRRGRRGRCRTPSRARCRGRERRRSRAAAADRWRPRVVRAHDRGQPDRGLLHAYYTLRAAGPHIAHEGGYALAIASLAAAVHPPLLGAYRASKAGVEALADSLRMELAPSGARVGVAYFAELDTDMVRQGFDTAAAKRLAEIRRRVARVTPLEVGIDAIERGIARRSRRVVAPRWVAAALPMRMLVSAPSTWPRAPRSRACSKSPAPRTRC